MQSAKTESDKREPETANLDKGMSVRTARTIEYSIIALCIVSLVLIFQPYDIRLFSVGAALVVLGGLAFNLVPQCRAGQPLKGVLKVGLIVLILLLVIAVIAMGAAYLYGIYVTSLRTG